MELNRLELLSSSVVEKIRDKCADILRGRKVAEVRAGALAWFTDRGGVKHTVRVSRINPKTVSCQEIDPVTLEPMRTKWKVSPMFLNPIVDEAKARKLEMPVVAHKPTTVMEGDSW